jgi:hypothetical protein
MTLARCLASVAAPVLVAGLSLAAVPAHAQWWDRPEAPGVLVGVVVEIEGQPVPLFPGPDGGNRWYLEARAGARYAVRVSNRTGERLGAAVVVDGLNAISGQRESGPGRMYILGPWEETTVRGWRTSLRDVQRFTFVDERTSYAARSGKANGKMGWIEVNVYRERRLHVRRPWLRDWVGRPRAEGPPAATAPEAASPSAPEAAPPAEPDDSPPADGKAAPSLEGERRNAPYADRQADGSYPGTGWGPHTDDPAVLVDFNPEPGPADCVTLRYEYAGALRALGILPRPWWGRDRLRERDRGEDGFARPPVW